MHELRQEALQQRKVDKLRRERAEYDMLTPEQKLKRDIRVRVYVGITYSYIHSAD